MKLREHIYSSIIIVFMVTLCNPDHEQQRSTTVKESGYQHNKEQDKKSIQHTPTRKKANTVFTNENDYTKYKIHNKSLENNPKYSRILVVFIHGMPFNKDIDSLIHNFSYLDKATPRKIGNSKIKTLKIRIDNMDNILFNHHAEVIREQIENAPFFQKENPVVILVGHSSGALSGISYAMDNISEANNVSDINANESTSQRSSGQKSIHAHRKKIIIPALISIVGILKGVHALQGKKEPGIVAIFQNLYIARYQKFKPLYQLTPGSDYLKSIKDYIMTRPKYQRIYCIGGYNKTFCKVRQRKLLSFFLDFNERKERDVYGSNKHDMFITIESQMADGIPNVDRHVVQSSIIHSELTKNAVLNGLSSPGVLLNTFGNNEIKGFIEKLHEDKLILRDQEALHLFTDIIKSYVE